MVDQPWVLHGYNTGLYGITVQISLANCLLNPVELFVHQSGGIEIGHTRLSVAFGLCHHFFGLSSFGTVFIYTIVESSKQ